MNKKERRTGFKNKIAICLSLLCLALMSSVGLASFFASPTTSVSNTSNISFLFSNLNTESVEVVDTSITPFKVTTEGFFDSSSNVSKTSFKFDVTMKIVSQLSVDSPINITLTQKQEEGGEEINLNLYQQQPTLVIGTTTSYTYSYDEENKSVIFPTSASKLGFINNGNTDITVNFSLKFTITDTGLISNFPLNIFDKIYKGKVYFALKVELFGD